jgi:hypothetical protein
LFTFQIGPDKKDITVHSFPLATLSPALHALMNGDMIEAKTRRIEWSDVDEDTFIRLCEFAYLHDYTPPSIHQLPRQGISPKKKSKKAKKKRDTESVSNVWDINCVPDLQPDLQPEPLPEAQA